MDLLSDILRTLRLRGTVYFRADFRSPWGMEVGGGPVASFHLVERGACWLRTREDDQPIQLAAGDVALFPRGAPHDLLCEPAASAVPAPTLIRVPSAAKTSSGIPAYGGSGETTTLVCGHFEYDRSAPHPFFEVLPPLVLVRAASGRRTHLLDAAAALAVAESSSQRAGSTAVVERLAEVLLVQALGTWLEGQERPTSFLAAIGDAAIGRALRLLHEAPAQAWSLDDLARAAGLSRTVFTARFRTLVGDSPMHYLTSWRMLLARDLLIENTLTTAQIAGRVGYRSEFAFAKAFKRHFDVSPGASRRAAS